MKASSWKLARISSRIQNFGQILLEILSSSFLSLASGVLYAFMSAKAWREGEPSSPGMACPDVERLFRLPCLPRWLRRLRLTGEGEERLLFLV